MRRPLWPSRGGLGVCHPCLETGGVVGKAGGRFVITSKTGQGAAHDLSTTWATSARPCDSQSD
eukprot:4458939-Prymnesium_polylepis.1